MPGPGGGGGREFDHLPRWGVECELPTSSFITSLEDPDLTTWFNICDPSLSEMGECKGKETACSEATFMRF